VVKVRSGLALVVGCVVGLGVVGSVASAPALAQRGGMMRMGMNLGGVGERVQPDDMDRYADLLDLSKDQREASKALHDAYAADYDQAEDIRTKAVQKARAEFEDTRDPAVWSEMLPKEMEKYGKRVKEIDDGFMNDLKTMLNSEQAGKWILVERARRRDGTMPNGMLSGESVDLTKVVKDLKIAAPMPDSLAQSLDRYETELDAALQERDAQRDEISKTMQNAGRGGPMGFDPQAFQKAMTDLRKAGIKVRDVNDRYSSMLESIVPEDKKPDYVKKVRSLKFPQVYREPYPLKAIDAAAGFKDLSAESKQAVVEVKAAYERDLAAANDRWARAIADEEKDGGGDLMAANMMRWMGGGEEGDSPQQQARKVRRDLDKAALDKLKALLTPEQVEKLPERDAERTSGWGGGGRGR